MATLGNDLLDFFHSRSPNLGESLESKVRISQENGGNFSTSVLLYCGMANKSFPKSRDSFSNKTQAAKFEFEAPKSGQFGEVSLNIDEELAIICLGTSTEQHIGLTERRLLSLSRAIQVAMQRGVRGIVLIGPCQGMFCMGLEISDLLRISTAKEAEDLSRQVQQLFDLIAGLPVTTVAAISGHCLSGGAELALACKYRLALSDDLSGHCRVGKIGFPDVQLGVIPCFGGTQRLPRIIGLSKTLNIISQGQMLDFSQAFDCGLVDQIVAANGVDPYEALKQAASELALGDIKLRKRGLSLKEAFCTHSYPGRNYIISRFKTSIAERCRDHYPAPAKALHAVNSGLKFGFRAGLVEETKAFGELAVTSECRSLLYLHNLREASKQIGKHMQVEVKSLRVALLGVDSSIAESVMTSIVTNGGNVLIIDMDSSSRLRGHSLAMEQRISKKIGISIDVLRNKISVSDKLSALSSADFIIDCSGKWLEYKENAAGEIFSFIRRDALLAINTSFAPVESLIMGIENPSRIIGMHLFEPISRVPIVELIRTPKTSTKTLVHAAAVVCNMGKIPIVVEDSPGFVINRILGAYFTECLHLLSDGYSLRVIEGAAESFGMSMGPFRLMDEIGIDIARSFMLGLSGVFGNRFDCPGILDKLLKSGRSGRKVGLGFYTYSHHTCSFDTAVESIIATIVKRDTIRNAVVKHVEDRLVLSMVNEAVMIMDEGLAGAPGSGAAGQIDLGTVLGLGFAPFRGGVLHYADSLGVDNLEEFLDNFCKNVGDRFMPCAGIVSRASRGESFLANSN